ncbi:MAG: hypothetical protein ACR2LI_07315 [Propionibacteriaceae bacterium]
MQGKTLMRLGVVVVAVMWAIGIIGLVRVLSFGAPTWPNVIIFGSVGMFGAMLAFVLAFIHVAMIAQRGQ